MKTLSLEKPSTWFRSAVSRGISAKDEPAIQRDGGKFNAGIIRGFSVITRGEALGHGLWIDAEMLSQVSAAIGTAPNGVKSRFAHPSLSGDGLGKMSARVFASVIDGDSVRADAHMLDSAHDTPDGDLADYLMSLAEEDPEAFGASISFRRDFQAEEDFMRKHGAVQRKNDAGYSYWDLSEFHSPDPKNTENLPHARLKSLRAVDFVDTPAANPDGLFHAGPFDLLENGNAILDYVFGVTDQAPETQLAIDPSRIRHFAAGWAAERKFGIQTKEKDMTISANANTTDPVSAPSEVDLSKPAEGAAPLADKPASNPADSSGSDGPKIERGYFMTEDKIASLEQAAADKAKTDLLAQQKEFCDQFGAENGVKWFAEGISLEEAQKRHISALTESNKELTTQLAAAKSGLGEEKPLSGVPADSKTVDSEEFKQLSMKLGPNLAKAAMAQKIPQPSTN